MLRRLLLIGSVLLGLCTGTAQAQIFLEEGKVSLAVSGGDRISRTLVVHNTSKEDIDLRVYWEDFEYVSPYDGAKTFRPGGSRPDSLSQWVSFSPGTIRLKANAKETINYTIAVPPTIKEGHYGVLFFEQSLGDTQTIKGVNIITRVGCLFFIEPKDKVKKLEMKNFKASGEKITGEFVNGGNIIIIPKTTYYLMDEGGVAAHRGSIKNLYIPPGVTASFDVEVPPLLKAGKYTAVINSDLEEGDVVVKEIELSKDASNQLTILNVRD